MSINKPLPVLQKTLSGAQKVDTIVIGAGVIGLAIARAVALHTNNNNKKDVLLIDRATNIGTETSSRNSEVIHAGLYYPHNSLKGKLCFTGRELLYKYCEEHSVPYNRCGKLIVANTGQQLSILRSLELQAAANGVYDTHIIPTQEKIHFDYMETEIVAQYGALFSPSTGIVNSHALMEQFRNDIENSNDATIALRTNVIDGYIDTSKNIHDDPYNIYVCTETTNHQSRGYTGTGTGSSSSRPENHRNQNVEDSDKMWLSCRQLINCSGLWASQVANLFHTNNTNTTVTSAKQRWTVPKQYYCRGTYYKVINNTQPNFRHLIYPVPDPTGSGLGIHATIDLSEPQPQVKFGPDVEWIDPPHIHPDDIKMEPSTTQLSKFYDWIRTYWPQLQDNTLVPDYCGLRPKLVHPSISSGDDGAKKNNKNKPGTSTKATTGTSTTSNTFQDFMIVGPKVHGVPGLVHLFGMESPGLTCSMAIANYVVNLLEEKGKGRK